MSNDTISDLLTRIRNAQRAGHRGVRIQHSKMAKNFLDVLKAEGFISEYSVKKDKEEKFDEFEVVLRYHDSGAPAIALAKRLSKPGRRAYARSGDIPSVQSGLGITVVSTSQGIMTGREANKRGIGGELLAQIGS